MKQLRLILSLITNDNDYQREQAAQAEMTARQLGHELRVLYADGDAVTQSNHLLDAIQAKTGKKTDGIIFDPVSQSGLPHVARAAVAAGIGVGVIDLHPTYFPELRKSDSVVVFGIGSDQVGVGRIQGRQLARLLPKGGNVLLIQGPTENLTASQRTQGLLETKPASVNLRRVKGKWSEESGYQVVKASLALATFRDSSIQCVAAQSDVMALGAKRAFEELAQSAQRERWLSLPFLGCDGLPETGQAWVLSNRLTATVIIPPSAAQAIRLMVDALTENKRPPEYSLILPKSFPDLELLK
jgi:ribose transport system substrate-binding protein